MCCDSNKHLRPPGVCRPPKPHPIKFNGDPRQSGGTNPSHYQRRQGMPRRGPCRQTAYTIRLHRAACIAVTPPRGHTCDEGHRHANGFQFRWFDDRVILLIEGRCIAILDLIVIPSLISTVNIPKVVGRNSSPPNGFPYSEDAVEPRLENKSTPTEDGQERDIVP